MVYLLALCCCRMGSHLQQETKDTAAAHEAQDSRSKSRWAALLTKDVAWGAAPPVELSEDDVKADLPRLVVDPAVPTVQPTAEVDVIVAAAGSFTPGPVKQHAQGQGPIRQAACSRLS